MKRIRENKGITLIALIITIIVMLILVGVTVSVVLNGGLFKKAQEAAEKTEQGKEKELIQLAYADYLSENVRNKIPEELEMYFLGQNKEGKFLFELMDENDSTDEIAVLTEFGILLYQEDITYDEENDEYYIPFNYNNNEYNIICKEVAVAESGSQTMFKVCGLETITTLNLQDAIVTGSSKEGWRIVFENTTGNSYDLLPDGRIVSQWWRLTSEEKDSLNDSYTGSGLYEVAANPAKILVGFSGGSEKGYSLLVIPDLVNSNNEIVKTYFFPITKEGVEYMEEKAPGIKIEMYKWYYGELGSSKIDNLELYGGTCPISLDDFTDDQIYCRTYLERVIKNFENRE